MFIVSFANSQCTTAMAGTFIQNDSCNGFSHFQASTVNFIEISSTDIIIQHFGEFLPYYDATVTLNCNDYTATIPTQNPGQTTLWGSGTFTSDYNHMTLNFTVDFGTSMSTCIAIYNRQGTGISEETQEQYQLFVFPNPFSDYVTIESGQLLTDATLTVFNSMGQAVKQMDNLSGQSIILYRDNLPGGLYFLGLTEDNKILLTYKVVITDN